MDVQQRGNHICLLYNTTDAYCHATASFIQQGIERHEKVHCIGETDLTENVTTTLTERGVDVQSYIDSGQLTFRSPREFYLQDGRLHPDTLLSRERMELRNTREQRYSGFRICGDMSWAARLPDIDPLFDYEIKVTDLLQEYEGSAMCLYDRRLFSKSTLLDIAGVHPTIKRDMITCDNTCHDIAAKLLGSL